MKTLTIPATIEHFDEAMDFISTSLEEFECPIKAQMKVELACDEIFSNVALYAYKTQGIEGNVTIKVNALNSQIIVHFIDEGTPYNPLEKKDPDTTLSADERDIGGLGIFLAKKSMDEMKYEYTNGQNQLTMIKNI